MDYDDNAYDYARDEYVNDLVYDKVGGLISQLIEALYSPDFEYDRGELEEIVVGLADSVGARIPSESIKWQLKPSRTFEMAKFMVMGV